jgi:hypothetical protein
VHFGGECKNPLDKIFNGGSGLGLERLHHNARATMRTIVGKNSIKKPAEEKIKKRAEEKNSLVKRTEESIASKEFEKNVGELAKKTAAKDADHYQVRLPPGLRDRVAQRAAENGRSMNTEIIEAIEQHLAGADRVTQLWEIFTKHRENIEAIPFLLYAMEQLSNAVSDSLGFNLSLMPYFRHWKEQREPEDVANLSLVTPDEVQTLRALLKEIGIDEQGLIIFLHVDRIENIRGFDRAKKSVEWMKAQGIRNLLRKTNTDENDFLLEMGVSRLEDIRSFQDVRNGIERLRRKSTAADDIRKLLKETNIDEKNFLSLLGVPRIEGIPSFEQAKDIIERIRRSRAN